jgi:hypothetical protein
LCNDRYRDQLQSVEQCLTHAFTEEGVTVCECQHQDRGGKRKANPSRQSTKPSRTKNAERKSYLTASRSRQGLCKCDDFSHGALVAPFPAFDNLLLKVSKMSDWSAE